MAADYVSSARTAPDSTSAAISAVQTGANLFCPRFQPKIIWYMSSGFEFRPLVLRSGPNCFKVGAGTVPACQVGPRHMLHTGTAGPNKAGWSKLVHASIDSIQHEQVTGWDLKRRTVMHDQKHARLCGPTCIAAHPAHNLVLQCVTM